MSTRTSEVGAFSLPKLARFHFRSWRVFTSEVGAGAIKANTNPDELTGQDDIMPSIIAKPPYTLKLGVTVMAFKSI
jgi:hypothetical protein